MFANLFSLLYSTVSTLFGSCFLFCVLAGFVFNWSIFLVSFAHQVTLIFCLLWIVFVLLVCTSVGGGRGMFLCFCFYLSDFCIYHLSGVHFLFLGILFVLIPITAIPVRMKRLSQSWTQLSNSELP